MNNRKLRVGFISSNPIAKTGFSRSAKALVPILYKTNKYDIFYLNQCTPPNNPEFQKLPWFCDGVYKNFDQNRFNQDPNYQRYVGYGNTMVEEFIVNNKLDVVFHIEDIWSSDIDTYLKSDWYNHIKANFVQWSTADSLPLLPNFLEWAEKCPNMWFWTSFAEREIKRLNAEKYKHCQTIHGAIQSSDFKPLDKNERLQLRNKFGIKDDEKICIYLGRNQLRKTGFWANQEALAQFKVEHPDKKFRLLFHCFVAEPGGWPIDRIRDELGLKKEDILTTYNCRNCGDWEVRPYEGEELNCSVCNAQKSRITAGVGSTIDEKDLNKIYNLADCSCSNFTSGGLEFTNIESLLAGLPLACTPYSSGEEFTVNDFVWSIESNYTREVGSAFKKASPVINSIVKFFEYIYDLPEEKRLDIVSRGREWAIKEFDAKYIAEKLEKFIDSCKPIDWDTYLESKKEIKNINAQIEDKQTDDEFVTECYQKILNMNPPSGEEGRTYWNNFLKQSKDKNQLKNEMVNLFRSEGFKHNMKVQPQTFESLLDETDKSRVLLVLKESLGDHVILTGLLPEIKKKYPESSIYIGLDMKYAEVYDLNPYVHKLLSWLPEFDNEMRMCGFGENKGYFNYYHNVGIASQKLLNYLYSKYE